MVECVLYREGGKARLYGEIKGTETLSIAIDTQSIQVYIETRGQEVLIGSHIEARNFKEQKPNGEARGRLERLVFIEKIPLGEFLNNQKGKLTEFFDLAGLYIKESMGDSFNIVGLGESLEKYPSVNFQNSNIEDNLPDIHYSIAKILIREPVNITSSTLIGSLNFLNEVIIELKDVLNLGFVFCVSDSDRGMSNADISIRKTQAPLEIDLSGKTSTFSEDDKIIFASILQLYTKTILKNLKNLNLSSRIKLSDYLFKLFLAEISKSGIDSSRLIENDLLGGRIFLEIFKQSLGKSHSETSVNFEVLYEKLSQKRRRDLQIALFKQNIFWNKGHSEAFEMMITKNDRRLYGAFQKLIFPEYTQYKTVLKSVSNKIAWKDPMVKRQALLMLENILGESDTSNQDIQTEFAREIFIRLREQNGLNPDFYEKYRVPLEKLRIIPKLSKRQNSMKFAKDCGLIILIACIGIGTGYQAAATNTLYSGNATIVQDFTLGFPLSLITIIAGLILLVLLIGLYCYRKSKSQY